MNSSIVKPVSFSRPARWCIGSSTAGTSEMWLPMSTTTNFCPGSMPYFFRISAGITSCPFDETVTIVAAIALTSRRLTFRSDCKTIPGRG